MDCFKKNKSVALYFESKKLDSGHTSWIFRFKLCKNMPKPTLESLFTNSQMCEKFIDETILGVRTQCAETKCS
jgi:hypothetical protein